MAKRNYIVFNVYDPDSGYEPVILERFTDEESAVQYTNELMSLNPEVIYAIHVSTSLDFPSIESGLPNKRRMYKGAGGCGNEMIPSKGKVIQRFCKFNPVDRHCLNCPNMDHVMPRSY